MTHSYFCNDPESIVRYRYCSFKARHSTGATKARWENEAKQARKEAISEKFRKDGAALKYSFYQPVRITGKVSFYQASDHSELNLRVLRKKTLPEINEAIKYWEDHLEKIDLSNIVKGVLRFQLRKLRTVRMAMESRSEP